jgi:hypothetical protein
MTKDEVLKFLTWYWTIMHPDLYVFILSVI